MTEFDLNDPAKLEEFIRISNFNVKRATDTEATDAEEFLRTGKSNVFYDKGNLVGTVGQLFAFITAKGLVYGFTTDYASSYGDFLKLCSGKPKKYKIGEQAAPDITPQAVLIDNTFNHEELKGMHKIYLLNADDDQDDGLQTSLVTQFNKQPSTSFNCLRRFYKCNSKLNYAQRGDEVFNRLISGQLAVIDFTFDHHIPLSQKENNLLKVGSKLTAKPGYSLMNSIKGNVWHRPGSVLFRDKENKLNILTGQDEGTFFGVELARATTSVNDAFESLIPDQVKGKKYQRQGEWFMVNVNKKEVPPHNQCFACSSDYMDLPLEHDDSHRHNIESDDIRVGRNGQIYALNARVNHEDHETIAVEVIYNTELCKYNENWVTFYKNTAKRSFSQEGVD